MINENEPLNPEEAANADFLLHMLAATVGGDPTLGVGVGEKEGAGVKQLVYAVSSTCDCTSCADYRKHYPLKFYGGMIEAARSYALTRVAYVDSFAEEEMPRTCH